MQKILKWMEYPERKPESAGRYLVTLRRPSAGHHVQIRLWSGVNWGQGGDVVAWMELPKSYGGIGYGGR